MRHGTLTVITRILTGRRAQVEACLAALEKAHAPLLQDIPELHFARWAVLDLSARGTSADARDLHLLFAADFTLDPGALPTPDGSPAHRKDAVLGALDARFLSLLVDHLAGLRARDGHSDFDALYQHCEEYGAGLEDPAHVKDWLQRHTVDCSARHVELVYRVETARGLHDLVDLHLRAVDHLCSAPLLQERGADTLLRRRHEELLALKTANGTPLPALARSDWLTTRLRPARLEAARACVELPLHYARLLPRILGLTFVKAVHDLGRDLAKGVKDRVLQVSWFLRGLAPPDEPFVPAPVPAEDPDRLVQLSLVLVSPIRSGPTGLRLVELALRLVNARLERYLIGLNEIQTIHCARWLLYSPSPREGRPREHFLLFVATYDNSWEDYIDAFVDNAKVRKFLVAIWRNTEGFPKLSPPLPFVRRRPFVEPFKRWIRGIEVPTGVMYSAALHGPPAPQPVSVLNLHSALLLRELLASRSNAVPWARTRRAEVRALTAFLSGGVCPVGRSFLPWPSAAWLLLKERVTQGWQRVLARLQPPVGALLAPRRTRDGAGPRHGTGVPEAALPPDAALEVAASGEAWRGHPAPAGGGLPGHAGRRLPVPPH